MPGFLLVAVLIWITAWHGDSAARMVATWWNSETFAHGLVVYPIAFWLIWRKRVELSHKPVRACLWALVPFALAAFIALLGTLGGVQAARQFGFVAMLALAAVAILGMPISRVIAFPLAFTLLAVPVGDFMLPTLMQHTADFTVRALRLSGVPVYREGLYFTVPSGRWSVVEACSGLRYLIASVTLGLLFAYLTYRTWWRRGLFVLASIVVPIAANWVRAYMIVMIGHLSNMRLAVGVDHLLYGWLFFGLVMLLLFWLGSLWREDVAGRPEAAPTAAFKVSTPGPSLVVAALGISALAIAGPLYVSHLDAAPVGPVAPLAAPEAFGGWRIAQGTVPELTPHFLHSRSHLQLSYEKDGKRVGLFIAYYARQREGAEMIGYGNDLVGRRDDWIRVADSKQRVEGQEVIQSRLQSGSRQLLTWHWYWLEGKKTVHPEEVKLRQALDRLVNGSDAAAVVVLQTSAEKSTSAGVLADFLRAMGRSIDTSLSAQRSPR